MVCFSWSSNTLARCGSGGAPRGCSSGVSAGAWPLRRSRPRTRCATDRITMNARTHFLSERPPDVHSSGPWTPFAYVNRRLEGLLRDLIAAAELRSGACVLDYGCAQQPYRRLLPDGVRYLGVDLPGN